MKCIGSVVALIGSVVGGGRAMAADFTVEELHKSSAAATETFKSEYGVALHDAVYGIQTTKGRESGKVKLFYKQDGANVVIEYFCHYHEPDVLDCHEH